MRVLNAPKLPLAWTSPTGGYMLLLDPLLFPSLAELAAPMHKLAGIRVNPNNNYFQNSYGAKNPRLVRISDGKTYPLGLPSNVEVIDVLWTVNGERFALIVKYPDHIGLWVGNVDGLAQRIEGIAINSLMGNAVRWLPDQERLLIRRIPERGRAPQPPEIPVGPKIFEADGASARSTYEARNLLETSYDDVLFDYYTKCDLVILNPMTGKLDVIGKPDYYRQLSVSPDGLYLLVKRLVKPWSHEVAFWRFGSKIEVWNLKGELVADIASLAVADQVPVRGVPLGPRIIKWHPTLPHTLYWVEALDNGDPMAKVPYRDQILCLEAPYNSSPKEVFKAEHRIYGYTWFEEGGLLMVKQSDRMSRMRSAWIVNIDKNTSRKWYEMDEADRYADPGYPLHRQLPNGYRVLREKDGAVYFRGSGGTEKGDRPFLDLRDIQSGETTRLFRCDTAHYQYFVAFAGDENNFVLSSESSSEVPNYFLATIGGSIDSPDGEASRSISYKAITKFKDPSPELRQIKKRIIRYERNDGVPLSFQLHLPPGYKEGELLPTVLYAYPREYSGAGTAGQVRGSVKRFMRINGASHLYFLLRGYAVLERTSMPMIGDPEKTYNTFVKQLVADAEAAVEKAVNIGVADPNRIGVIGHSHGGLMVANLLAHTDLFKAGIARSGSYNKTNQPFGFQSERRSLFDAQDIYIQVSPTFFANKVNEPILIIHGDDDSNPGTLTPQSEVFYEAVRGSGGTARLVLLPYEDHGYRARESVEHVLWEQLNWFDKYIKNPTP
jgi:dipeptidyl aminopeptidase/acylaminoacyl peptidase